MSYVKVCVMCLSYACLKFLLHHFQYWNRTFKIFSRYYPAIYPFAIVYVRVTCYCNVFFCISETI